MDSREIHQQHLQQHVVQLQQQQQQLQSPPGNGMLMTHNNSFNQNPNAAALMTPTSTSQAAIHYRLPFGSHHPHPLHYPQPQQQMDQKTIDSLGYDGLPSSVATQQSMGFGIDQQQQVKKKRGRPRKYAPEGNIALALAPASPLPSASNSYGGGGANANSSDPPAKRNRGRPPGSGKKQLDALGGTAGVGFTPHVIEVNTGEDIALKVMEFTSQGPRVISILSATGSVSSVMLRQATNPNGVVKCEGPYEIVSLSGSFLNSESDDTATKSGSLSVTLARPNGQILGGCVAGMLIAGSQVQVIVGSFVPDGKKQKQNVGRAQNNPEPSSAPVNMLNFGSGGDGSPRSSEASEEHESKSQLQHENEGLFGNSTTGQAQQQQQQLQQMPMQMYHHNLWTGHGQ